MYRIWSFENALFYNNADNLQGRMPNIYHQQIYQYISFLRILLKNQS